MPGFYVAFAICALFFIAGLVAMWWAFKHEQFDDIEASKFEMMDDGDTAAAGSQAAGQGIHESPKDGAGSANSSTPGQPPADAGKKDNFETQSAGGAKTDR